MDKKQITREEIIAEYLTGNISYRALGKKHSVPSRKHLCKLKSWSDEMPNAPYSNSFINLS